MNSLAESVKMRSTLSDILLASLALVAIMALTNLQKTSWMAGGFGDVSWLMNQAFNWISFIVGSILKFFNAS